MHLLSFLQVRKDTTDLENITVLQESPNINGNGHGRLIGRWISGVLNMWRGMLFVIGLELLLRPRDLSCL